MPKMGGFELHRRIVASGHIIPTVFLTAFADQKGHHRAMKGGAIACLSKPAPNCMRTFTWSSRLTDQDKGFTDYPALAPCRYPRLPRDIS